MEKVTKEYLSKLNPITRGRRKSYFTLKCSLLKVGEILFITRKEWKDYGYSKNTTPNNLILSAIYQTRNQHKSKVAGMKFKTVTFLEGWSVEKIKN